MSPGLSFGLIYFWHSRHFIQVWQARLPSAASGRVVGLHSEPLGRRLAVLTTDGAVEVVRLALSGQRVAQGEDGFAERRQPVGGDGEMAVAESGAQRAKAAIADDESCQCLVRAFDEMDLSCVAEPAGAAGGVVEQGADGLGQGV